MTETGRTADWAIGQVARPLPAVGPEMPCGRVYARMQELGASAGLAVVQDGCPVGLAGRRRLMHQLAHPVTYALYENRRIALVMEQAPLIVDAATSVDRVTELIATEKVSALDDGFIVVDAGRYVGVGTITELLNLSVEKARSQIHEIDAARAAAERASDSKSRFLANLSHELRTPLNAILGFAELIESGTAGAVTDKQAEYLGDIQNSGRRLLTLINDLLDLSRAESGRLELHAESVELDILLSEAHRTLMPRAKAKGLSFEIARHAPLVIRGDEQKLLQVLLNLLNNAVKFTPEGETVRLSSEVAADGGVALHVVDTGAGIPEGDRARIMEPFGRGRDQATRRAEGAGVGLALTKVLVEAHQGELALNSEPGAGTRFTVYLPPARVVGPDPVNGPGDGPGMAAAQGGGYTGGA